LLRHNSSRLFPISRLPREHATAQLGEALVRISASRPTIIRNDPMPLEGRPPTKHRRQGDCRVHDSVHESASFSKSTVEQARANRQPVQPSYDQHSLYNKMSEYTDMEQCKKTQYDSKSRLQCTYIQLSTTLEDLRARQVPQVAVNYHICSPGPMHDIRALY
jgi:hypothetical protein